MVLSEILNGKRNLMPAQWVHIFYRPSAHQRVAIIYCTLSARQLDGSYLRALVNNGNNCIFIFDFCIDRVCKGDSDIEIF